MKNMFDAATIDEVKSRLEKLKPQSEPQWGTMTAAQAVAHCSAGLEMAAGKITPPRMFIGQLIGRFVKPIALRDDEPIRQNSQTLKGLAVNDKRDLATERDRLCKLMDRFATVGPKGCTTHPHSFFGRLTAQEWAILMYKHLDHHLRQFGT